MWDGGSGKALHAEAMAKPPKLLPSRPAASMIRAMAWNTARLPPRTAGEACLRGRVRVAYQPPGGIRDRADGVIAVEVTPRSPFKVLETEDR